MVSLQGADLVRGIRARAEWRGPAQEGGWLEEGEEGVHTAERMKAEMDDLIHTGVLLRQVNESGAIATSFSLLEKGVTNMERQKPE